MASLKHLERPGLHFACGMVIHGGVPWPHGSNTDGEYLAGLLVGSTAECRGLIEA